MVQATREPIHSEASVFHARRLARATALSLGFPAVRAVELETAVSEVAQNAIDHARGGWVEIVPIRLGERLGLRIVVTDNGPGIPDVARVLRGGYSTKGTLGVGLSACTRLMDHVEIETIPGEGTRLSMVKWSHDDGKP